MDDLTADKFIEELKANSQPGGQKTSGFVEDSGNPAQMIGVRMGTVFEIAKRFTKMPLTEVSRLLDSRFYEARLGAVSIMDFQARKPKLTPEESAALFDLYLSKHERIDNWGLVDRAAPRVIGRHLEDKPRDILLQLAKSDRVSQRRTAIVAPLWLITRKKEVDDALAVAELLLEDKHELIHSALGATLHYVGSVDKAKLDEFLQKHHKKMSRTTLRLATRQLPNLKKKYS